MSDFPSMPPAYLTPSLPSVPAVAKRRSWRPAFVAIGATLMLWVAWSAITLACAAR